TSGRRICRRAAWRSCSRCPSPASPRSRFPPMPDPLVLLLEHEPHIRKFLRATPEGQGSRLFEAPSGADGVVEVGSRQPDVVIVDLGLPDMDGLDVIRRMREGTHAPVTGVSAA